MTFHQHYKHVHMATATLNEILFVLRKESYLIRRNDKLVRKQEWKKYNFVFHSHLQQPRVIRCFQPFSSPLPFWCTLFCFVILPPTIIAIAINSICVPRCFSRAAAAAALQKTNIHRRQAQSGRPLMRGTSLPLSCVTVLKSLHGELINFFSSSSVLVCLRKTKTARVPAWCQRLHSSSVVSSVVLPLFQSALLSRSHPAPLLPSQSPFQRVSVSPSATCEGSLVPPSLNK